MSVKPPPEPKPPEPTPHPSPTEPEPHEAQPMPGAPPRPQMLPRLRLAALPLIALALALALCGAACERKKDEPKASPVTFTPAPTAVGGGPTATKREDAIDAIARALCDLEAACGAAPRGDPTHPSACVATARERFAPHLAVKGCQHDLDGARLSDCVEAIRETDTTRCSTEIPRACEPARLCR